MDINATLIGQAIWFGLFIWITMKFVWPPLQKAMAIRQQQIADGLAAAERGKQEFASAQKRVDEELSAAKGRAAEIVAQAEKRAAQVVEDSKATAKIEGDRVLAAARAEVEQAVSRAKEDLRDQVARLAVAGAEKILRREVDANAHAQMLTQLKQEL